MGTIKNVAIYSRKSKYTGKGENTNDFAVFSVYFSKHLDKNIFQEQYIEVTVL